MLDPVTVVIFICIIAIVLVVLKYSGVTLPPWFWHIVAIVALGFVAVAAIKLLYRM